MKPVFVHVVCEGPTEKTFVQEVVAPEFPRIRLIPFLPGRANGAPRGGDIKHDRVLPDIVNTLKSDPGCYCTTMFDFYRIGRFPQLEEPRGDGPELRAARIEGALVRSVLARLGKDPQSGRFRPYLSMHEFEALLFSDPARLAEGIGRPDLEARLASIRGEFETPEQINEGPDTAPSKRLLALDLHPRYHKIATGILAAKKVGIDAMRAACPRFRAWLEWLGEIERSVPGASGC